MHRLQILHAVPIRNRHSRHFRTLQPLHKRRQRAPRQFRPALCRRSPTLPVRLRPLRSATAPGRPLHNMRSMRDALPTDHPHPHAPETDRRLRRIPPRRHPIAPSIRILFRLNHTNNCTPKLAIKLLGCSSILWYIYFSRWQSVDGDFGGL